MENEVFLGKKKKKRTGSDDFILHVLCEMSKSDYVFSSDDMDGPVEDIGSRSCVTRFVKTLLSIMEHGVKPHSKHLTEYFAFLYEFAKMGEEEVSIALDIRMQFIKLHLYFQVTQYVHISEPVLALIASHINNGPFLHGN